MRFFPRLVYALACLLAPAAAWAVEPLRLVQDARWQIGRTIAYDPAYSRLAYPMGDVPLARGVCTDVVIRALRR